MRARKGGASAAAAAAAMSVGISSLLLLFLCRCSAAMVVMAVPETPNVQQHAGRHRQQVRRRDSSDWLRRRIPASPEERAAFAVQLGAEREGMRLQRQLQRRDDADADADADAVPESSQRTQLPPDRNQGHASILARRHRRTMTSETFATQCLESLVRSKTNRADNLISQHELAAFLNDVCTSTGSCPPPSVPVEFHELYWTTQVKFVWSLCNVNADSNGQDGADLEECLEELEADGEDEPFGYDLGPNNENLVEVRKEIRDMCGSIYDDVVEQGLVPPAEAEAEDEVVEDEVTTEAPTEASTEASTEGPTQALVEPTEAPVEPTEAPVEPTEAPVEPTPAPVEPTPAPVVPATPEPTDMPVAAPVTAEPTLAPVTDAPVAVPTTDDPTVTPAMPTASPTGPTTDSPTPAVLTPTASPTTTAAVNDTTAVPTAAVQEQPTVDPTTSPSPAASSTTAPTSGNVSSDGDGTLGPFASISPNQSSYAAGEDVVVAFINPDAAEGNWIAIGPAGSDVNGTIPDDSSYVEWVWTCGTQECVGSESVGEINFGVIPPGEYQTYLLSSGNAPPYTIKASSAPFTVYAAPTMSPTEAPTVAPTAFPTTAPTATPTAFPTVTPTASPDAAVSTAQLQYFDVFFTYRLDLSDDSMDAERVKMSLSNQLILAIAVMLESQDILRQLRISRKLVELSLAHTDPIEHVSFADTECPDDAAANANSCVLIVSLVHVQALSGAETQASAENAVQSSILVSMSPISTAFAEAMDADEVVGVAWIQGGIPSLPQADSVALGESDGGGISNGVIAAASVGLFVLFAGLLFAFKKLRRDDDDSEADVRELKNVNPDELKDVEGGMDALVDNDDLSQDISALTPTGVPMPDFAGLTESIQPESRKKTSQLEVQTEGSGRDKRFAPVVGPDGREVAQFSPLNVDPTATGNFDHAASDASSVGSSPSKSAKGGVMTEAVAGAMVAGTMHQERQNESYDGDSHADSSFDDSSLSASTQTGDGTGTREPTIVQPIEQIKHRFDLSQPIELAEGQLLEYTAIAELDAALDSGDWAGVLRVAGEMSNKDEDSSRPSELSSMRSPSQSSSMARARPQLSEEDAKKAAHLDELIAVGDWHAVGSTAAKYDSEEKEHPQPAAPTVSAVASQKKRSFIDIVTGRSAPSVAETAAVIPEEGADVSEHGSAKAGSAGTPASAVAENTDAVMVGGTPVAAVASAHHTTNEEKLQDMPASPITTDVSSPSTTSPPGLQSSVQGKDGSPDSGRAPNPYLDQTEAMDWAVMSSLDALAQDKSHSEDDQSSSLDTGDDKPLVAKTKSSRRKLGFGFGSKRSDPSASDFVDHDEGLTTEDDKGKSWKQKLGFGKSSKKTSKAAATSLALQEDSSVESRSLGSDAITGQEEKSSKPSDMPSERSSDVGHAEAFAAAPLPIANVETQSNPSSDAYASSVTSFTAGDYEIADDASKGNVSLRDELDQAIERGDWEAVERQAAEMLEVSSSASSGTGIPSSIDTSAVVSGDDRSRKSLQSSKSSTGASVNDEKIKALEQLIEADDWQGIVETASKYSKDAKSRSSGTSGSSSGDKVVDSSEADTGGGRDDDVTAEAQKWEAIAQDAASKILPDKNATGASDAKE